MRIVLASASPRRRELLEQMGLEFEVIPSDREEIITQSSPEQVVMELARQKAGQVAAQMTGDVCVIGADTIVVYENRILGKPKDEADAKRMLTMLQGNVHQVYTGVCLMKTENGKTGVHTFFEKTDVHFYPMTEDEIETYVAGGEPMDKAGAYGIQGRGGIYVERINGDYNNVVGLPIARLYHELFA